MSGGYSRKSGNPKLTDLSIVQYMPDPLLNFKWIASGLPFSIPNNYVEAVDLSFLNVSVGDKVHSASGYYYYPGTHDIAAFSITFYEDCMGNTLRRLTEWKNQIKNFKTGVYKLPSEYKKNIRVSMLDTANNPVITADLLGIWPTDTGNVSLNYTGGERITITQNFSIDDADLLFPDYPNFLK